MTVNLYNYYSSLNHLNLSHGKTAAAAAFTTTTSVTKFEIDFFQTFLVRNQPVVLDRAIRSESSEILSAERSAVVAEVIVAQSNSKVVIRFAAISRSRW